ncbi:MAG: glutamine-hydrolyzing carbamoyl-phosphate synthase small subunit [Acidimicrobiales bacterium]
MIRINNSTLVLADGAIFQGCQIGHSPSKEYATGEVVFNTVLSGYQEVITDPSYAGQIITFTYPHIGNYGVNKVDNESGRPHCRGVVVRDLARRHSNWRATTDLNSFLEEMKIPGIAGLDTRRLTMHIRESGAMPAAFGTLPADELHEIAKSEPGTSGIDLVSQVTTSESYMIKGDRQDKLIVAMDFGIKATIINHLKRLGNVFVVPATTSSREILELNPDGVFLSNGPGDPEVVQGVPETISELIGKVPIFGICLGHQLLGLAVGGTIEKMTFGHHGGNHPVQQVHNGVVEITSQNHNFAINPDSIAKVAEVTHINLNDGVCQGIRLKSAPAFSVQHHPEAGPGPHDSSYLFDDFGKLLLMDVLDVGTKLLGASVFAGSLN